MSAFNFDYSGGVASLKKDSVVMREFSGNFSALCTPTKNSAGVVDSFILEVPSHNYNYRFYLAGNTFIINAVDLTASGINAIINAILGQVFPKAAASALSTALIASDSEMQTGTNDAKVSTPLKIANWFAWIKTQANTFTDYVSAKGFKTTPTNGTGFIEMNGQTVTPATPGAGIMRLFADASGRLSWITQLGFLRSFRSSALTGNRVYTLQDRDGTLADDTDLALKANLNNVCRIVASTLASAGSPQSVTGTTAETTLYTAAIPAGSVRAGGSLDITYAYSHTNSAGTKRYQIKLNGITVSDFTASTSATAGKFITTITNIDNANALLDIGATGQGAIGFNATSGGSSSSFALDWANLTLTVTCILSSTGDTGALKRLRAIAMN